MLAAPRVDYLVESVAKRQDRERRAAQASARHLQQRMHTVERLSHSPKSQSPPSAIPSATSSSSNSASPYESGRAPHQSHAAQASHNQPPSDSQIATPLDMMDLFELGGDFMFPDLANDHDPAMVSASVSYPPVTVWALGLTVSILTYRHSSSRILSNKLLFHHHHHLPPPTTRTRGSTRPASRTISTEEVTRPGTRVGRTIAAANAD